MPNIQNCILCKKEIKNKKKCRACDTRLRRYINKEKAIEYLGGKCYYCGFIGNIASYDFHHINPSEKKFQIGSIYNMKWEYIVQELDKCVLTCRNCHSVQHIKDRDKEFLRVVEEYKDAYLENIGCYIYRKTYNNKSRNNCDVCGKKINGLNTKCIKCRGYTPRLQQRKVERPTKEELEKMLWEKPTTVIAKEYKVSDKCIEKWAKIYNLTKPPRGYWQKRKY